MDTRKNRRDLMTGQVKCVSLYNITVLHTFSLKLTDDIYHVTVTWGFQKF